MYNLKYIFYKLKNFFSFKNILIIIVFILICLDVILFISYRIINPQLNLAAQLIGYVSSPAFRIVTASLIFPLIPLLGEYIFKINEKRAEEKKGRQIDCINVTNELWEDFAEITAKFVYSEGFNESNIADLKIKVEKLIIKAEKALNSWYFEFKNLEDILGKNSRYFNMILIPMSVLESSISSALVSNEVKTNDKIKIPVIQEHIKIIYNGIKAATHHRGINLMKYSMLLSDKYDENYENKIKEEYLSLKEFNSVLINEIYQNYQLHSSNGDLKHINDFLDEMKYKEDYNSKSFQKRFEDIYDEIPDEKKIYLNDIHEFSLDLIEKLAYIIKIRDLNANFNHFREDYILLKNQSKK